MAKDVRSNQRDELRLKKQEKRDAAKKAEIKKHRQHMAIFIGIIVVLAAFAALLIFNKCSTSGSSERNTVVAETENFEVSQAMMTYFFNTIYNQYASVYSQDTDSFNSFIGEINNRGEAYTTLLSYAQQNVEQYLTLAEMAKAKGVELDDADEAEIDKTIEEYKDLKQQYAESNNAYSIMTFDKFLSTMFGDSVNESVIRDCLELTSLVSKYQDVFVDELEYTDDDYTAYFDEHSEDYLYVDLLKYTFSDPETTEATDDTADAADTTEADDTTEDAAATEETKDAKTLADELAATKSADDFNAYMKEYLTVEQKKNTADGEEVDMDKVQENVDALAVTKQLKSSITDEDAKDWAFADGTAVGATKIIADEEGGKYTVYMITKTSYRDEELTKNAAAILLSDSNYNGDSQSKAEEIKAEWDAGEKTEEAFEALCEKYSENSHHHVEEGYTRSNAGAIADWLFDESRAEGDVDIVRSDSESATYIVYFAGDGIEGWKSAVRSAKQNEDLNAAIDAFKAEHNVSDDAENATVVTFDDAALKKVKPIVLSEKTA